MSRENPQQLRRSHEYSCDRLFDGEYNLIMNHDMERFAIPDAVGFEIGQGSLTRAVLASPHATAHVYLHGAHVTHFQSRDQIQSRDQAPLLFLSRNSAWNEAKAIRGGVPIIFPWFGPNSENATLPAHGFARVHAWQVESTHSDADSTTLVLALQSSEATRALWPHDFLLRFSVRVSQSLEMTLEVFNTGTAPFQFEEALHAYLAVSDAREVAVEGLNQTRYIDKVDGAKIKTEDAEAIRMDGETDRVYLDTQATCISRDVNRSITIEKTGSDSTVLWNPHIEKARALSDLGDDEWPRFVCVESGNLGPNAKMLNAGESHVMKVVIAVQAAA